jgi:hypothetical protein
MLSDKLKIKLNQSFRLFGGAVDIIYKKRDQKAAEERESLINRLSKIPVTEVIQLTKPNNRLPALKEERELNMDGQTISWFAVAELRKRKGEEDKNLLITALQEPLKYEKDYVLYTLGFLCSHTQDKELFRFLMKELAPPQNKDLVTTALMGLRNFIITPELSINTLLRYAQIKNNNSLRVHALQALSHCQHPGIEDFFLNTLKGASNNIRSMLMFPLETVVTKKSKPILEQMYKRTRDYGLRSDIERIIAKIEMQ